MERERGLGVHVCREEAERNRAVFLWVAATKCHRLGDETTNVCSSQFWRQGSLRSRPRQIPCLVKSCFLDCRRLSSCCVLTEQGAEKETVPLSRLLSSELGVRA